MDLLIDSLQIVQTASHSTLNYPHYYNIATLFVTMAVAFLTIRFAGNRLIKNHAYQEKQVLDQFKINMQKDVLLLDKCKVDWSKFDEQRKEYNESTRRIHERMEESALTFTQCMAQIKKDVIQISGITLELKGAFDEHKRVS